MKLPKEIQTFEGLEEIAALANVNRLCKSGYRDSIVLTYHADNRSFKTVLVKIRFLRFLRSLSYGWLNEGFMRAREYSDALIEAFKANTEGYRQSYELMSDEKSRRLFLNVLAGEMLCDVRYGVPFKPNDHSMGGYCHVNDLPEGDEAFFRAGEVLVDCGAYTGDTLQELIDAGYKPKKYFGFEPDPGNYHNAKDRLAESGVEGEVYNAAVFKENCTLRFDSIDGGSSQVTGDGSISVDALSIDQTINEPVTLIKMDIEGSECDALEGAAHVIKKYKPKLAISVYHKPTDLAYIPQLIKKLNADYSMFSVRWRANHYLASYGFVDVVLYVR